MADIRKLLREFGISFDNGEILKSFNRSRDNRIIYNDEIIEELNKIVNNRII